MELSLESLLSPGGLLGNLSYVLLIVSMAMRDMFWLRLIAIGSGLTGIAYDAWWLHNPVGVFWESCFTLVNVVQWGLLLRERKRVALTPDESRLKLFLFPSISDGAFRRLLGIATLHEAPRGTVLIRQGERVERLIVLTDGVADIQVGETVVATCRAGDLVGELSLVSNSPATATVTTHTDARYFSFEQLAVRALLERSEELSRAFSTMLSANLAKKLVLTNESVSR